VLMVRVHGVQSTGGNITSAPNKRSKCLSIFQITQQNFRQVELSV